MSTLTKRHSKLESKLDKTIDISLTIQGIPTIIEYSYHSIERSNHRGIFRAAVTNMIQLGFDKILDLKSDERFILIDNELGISVVGNVKGFGGDILISIISVLDSTEPTNPYHTYTIAI
ncbi:MULTISPECIES: hypothetical protein [Bacillus subtilis group]|uniref:hypothetical protein n=1 Tax=Bacillus subtilis group TaxID=653685 RepID=UPI001A92922B|nr:MULTISPECIES: hypothetical protein [Bacillus subtilis group]MCY9308737.1 hypothetical protein [Bacillus inaquosorum]BCT30308.1 hypothetical protein BVAD3_39820 [Bacillus velezensis]